MPTHSGPGKHVVVIGGYGFFGGRLVRRLAAHEALTITVAGRSLAQATALVETLRPTARARLQTAALDAHADTLTRQLRTLAPGMLIHTSGPFQGQDYRVAQACIAAGVHYIDLADGRTFVQDISTLDAAARQAGVLVVSGASSVPALSGAAADHLAQGLATVDAIDIGISPGNRTERGLSTVQAILSYCGKPLPSAHEPVFGWRGTWRHRYPAPVGARLMSPCDVPDLTLLPTRYPGTPRVRFGAGLELRLLHRGMNLMSALAKAGLVRDWSRHARWLKAVSEWLLPFGTDAGAMHVRIEGRDGGNQARTRLWHLVAARGDGPYVPTLAAAALVRRWLEGTLPQRGALPCIGLLTLADFARETEGLAITMQDTPA
ncbi:saccharopine dehydrogenase family protein [Ralstonia solanacearum]|uniref:saccharopine dehydrogenase family protein n=1 Tax=Ralstonia solanacearum TaxID=305 RepID=UPI001FF89413